MNYRNLGKVLLAIGLLSQLFAGCAMAQMSGGERFTIGISEQSGDAKLGMGSIISDDKKIIILEPSAWQSYGQSNDVQIPESFEFAWREKNEKEPHLEKIKVRSRIPSEVFNQLHANRKNSLRIQFFVKNGKPSFRWILRKIELNGDSIVLSKGEG